MLFLMFGLGRMDVLPVGDYGVKKLFGLDALPRPAELERIAEPWKPYRSMAAWYVWRSLDVAKQNQK